MPNKSHRFIDGGATLIQIREKKHCRPANFLHDAAAAVKDRP